MGPVDLYNELKKEFVLNSAALQNRGTQSIEEGELYKMLIYAVPDIEHKGSVLLAGETAPRTWGMFFSNTGDLAGCGKEFHKIIDGFWNADGSHKTTDAAVEPAPLLRLISENCGSLMVTRNLISSLLAWLT